MLDKVFVPIAREGWPFIAIFAAAAFFLWSWEEWMIVPGAVLTLWCVYFFRDPDRTTPTRRGLVISPADGEVIGVGPAPWPSQLGMGEGQAKRICIFMNVFDVHVNRIPVDGKILKLAYIPGKFINASFDKASEDNERQLVAMETEDGQPVAFVQIAGLVARRIVCKISEGQAVSAGERMGLIRFGSRVDVYLPLETASHVAVGQRCVAGETVLADLAAASDGEKADRAGAIR